MIEIFSHNTDTHLDINRLHELPFLNLTESELVELSFSSNTKCLCSINRSKSKLSLLPRLQVTESTSKIAFLSHKFGFSNSKFSAQKCVQMPTLHTENY